MITLDDLVPERASFKLKDTGGKDHFIRPVSMEDWRWLNDKYGQKKFNEFFYQARIREVAPFLYRLLEDKSDFPAADKSDYLDDDGEIVKGHRLSGFQVFLTRLSGYQEEILVMKAFCKALGASEAVIGRYSKEEIAKYIEDKKKDQ